MKTQKEIDDAQRKLVDVNSQIFKAQRHLDLLNEARRELINYLDINKTVDERLK